MKISREEFGALLRTDFVAFSMRAFSELNPQTNYLHNWHIDMIADALEQCRRGQLRRLVITVPPRSLKSHLVTIAFVAWLLGHRAASQIICASYAQDLSDKLAADCRSVMMSEWYGLLFPTTRLASRRESVHDFFTTGKGFRLATSIGGMMTGRGADFIIIDDPLKPDEALSETQRQKANDWYDHTLVSRLNDKHTGCIILVMQRLHEDDLVGHVVRQGGWHVLKFPAIAEEKETHTFQTPYGRRVVHREEGQALHPERESVEVLAGMREVQGEYNFSGQYQQSPAPLGGGLIKTAWFKFYSDAELPTEFEMILQSWDTANKPSHLNNYSVCTTWGVKSKNLYLIHVLRKRLGYPELKRAVLEQLQTFKPRVVLIEDKASGTQLLQELKADGIQATTGYEPSMEKTMRMHSVSNTIENGFVYLPSKAPWLAEYLHELATFPNGTYDDQVDSTSQALDWFKNSSKIGELGLLRYYEIQAGIIEAGRRTLDQTSPMPCTKCDGFMTQRIADFLRCPQCGTQYCPKPRQIIGFSRADVLS